MSVPKPAPGRHQNPAPGEPNVLTAPNLLRLDLPPLAWAVPDLLPAGLALLAGKPKSGKSWLMLGTVLGVGGLGGSDLHHALYIGFEDTLRRLQERMIGLLGGEPPRESAHLSCDWPTGDEGLARLEAWLKQNPLVRLVVVDTLPWFLGGRKARNDVYQADYEGLRPLKRLADKYQCCIVGVAHQRKAPSQDPFSSLVGTTGLTGGADTLLVLNRQRQSEDAVLHVTGRDVEDQELAMRWRPDECRWEVLGAVTREPTRDQLQVISLLASQGPLTPARGAPLLGKSEAATKKLFWRMAKAGLLESSPEGAYRVGSVSPRSPMSPLALPVPDVSGRPPRPHSPPPSPAPPPRAGEELEGERQAGDEGDIGDRGDAWEADGGYGPDSFDFRYGANEH